MIRMNIWQTDDSRDKLYCIIRFLYGLSGIGFISMTVVRLHLARTIKGKLFMTSTPTVQLPTFIEGQSAKRFPALANQSMFPFV